MGTEIASVFPLNKPDFRTSLQKNQSLFPGNGFLPAETSAPEWPLRQTSRLKETNHAHETRLIRVILRQLGKSQFAQDCVVADAVTVEPVSATKFPANRENNREFCRFRSESEILVASRLANSIL